MSATRSSMIVCRALPPRVLPIPQISHFRTLNAKSLDASIPSEGCRKSISATGGRGRSSSRRRLIFLSILPVSILLVPNISAASPSSGFDDLVTDEDSGASSDVSRRVGDAVRLLDLARELQAKGDFSLALNCFTQVINDYKDFAFTEYARVGRALLLYEVGDREEAIAEMEDVSISLKGYPEIHAALAAALYTDRHAPLLAENQFTIATILDPHYADISYVREEKHWPPSLFEQKSHKEWKSRRYNNCSFSVLVNQDESSQGMLCRLKTVNQGDFANGLSVDQTEQ